MPTLSTTPIDGGAIRASTAMCPTPAGRQLQHQVSGVRGGSQHCVGVPEFVVERLRRRHRSPPPARAIAATRSLVEVLPAEPVMPDDRAARPAISAAARDRGQRGQRGQHVGRHLDQRQIGVDRAACPAPRPHRRRRRRRRSRGRRRVRRRSRRTAIPAAPCGCRTRPTCRHQRCAAPDGAAPAASSTAAIAPTVSGESGAAGCSGSSGCDRGRQPAGGERGGGQFVDVGERDDLVLHVLALFVALAGDDHRVTRPGGGDGGPDAPRRSPISRTREPVRCGRRPGAQDLRPDRGRILGPRVVVGDDDQFGAQLRRRPPISGRLPRSRSPPAPITRMTLPTVSGRSASRMAPSAAGLCA